MKWRSASSARRFRLLTQILTLDQVAEFRRTRRMKEGTGSSASVSAAFGPVGPIHPGNPGLFGSGCESHPAALHLLQIILTCLGYSAAAITLRPDGGMPITCPHSLH